MTTTRKQIALSVFLITVMACGGGPAETAPVTTSLGPTPVLSPTSTTLRQGAVQIPGRTLVLEPGTYVTNRFLVPLRMSIEETGWHSYGAEDQWVLLRYIEDGATDPALSLLIVAYRPTDPPDAIAGEIISMEGVSRLAEPRPTMVNDFEATVVAVEGDPEPVHNAPTDCSEPPGSGRFFEQGPGYPLFTEAADAFGIPACYRSRIWLVDVGGTTVTIIATVVEAEDFDHLIDNVEDLVEGLEFGGGE